jgi:hypothetical protein
MEQSTNSEQITVTLKFGNVNVVVCRTPGDAAKVASLHFVEQMKKKPNCMITQIINF